MSRVVYIFTAAICCLLAGACTEKGGNGPVKLTFAKSSITLDVGETCTPEMKIVEKGSYKSYDPVANPLGLKFKSADESVFTVSESCEISALAPGEATLTVSGDGQFAKLKVSVSSKTYRMPDIKAAFDPSMVQGQYAMKGSDGGNLNPQSFDIDDNGKIWLEGAKRPFVYIQRFKQAGKVNTDNLTLNGCQSDAAMEVFYAGHGTCLCVEPGTDPDKQYFWFANFGTKQSDGSYLKPKVLSRALYVPGKRILPQEAEEHFYFGEEYIQMLPCVDFESGVVAIWVSSKATVTMFRLEDVLNAPVKDITIGNLVWGGESVSPAQYATEGNVSVTVKAHDCQALTPVAKFKMIAGGGTQGYCVYGSDHVSYHLMGAATPVNTMLTVYDFQGNPVLQSEGFGFDDDISTLIANGLTTKEYLEAEGIRIRNRRMYICLASSFGGNRVTTILQF